MATKTPKVEAMRKLTIKSVCGLDREQLLEMVMKDKQKVFPLVKIYGVVTRTRPGESDFGDFVRFIGQFRAVDMATGEVKAAPVVILPKFLEDELAGALAGGAKDVQFAVQIGVKYDKTAATSYVYMADNLIEPSQNDALTAIEQRMGIAPKLDDKTKPDAKK